LSKYPGRKSEAMGEGPRRGPPRRAVPTNIANGARLLTGRARPTIPQSVVGSTRTAAEIYRLTKPFHSANKPWKKPGSGNTNQISNLTEEIDKLKKRLKKSKKRGEKHGRDS